MPGRTDMPRPTVMSRSNGQELRRQRPGRSPHRRPSTAALSVPRSRDGAVRYSRPAPARSGWQVKLDRPGRLRLKNPVLYRKSDLCQAIERELMSVLGIDKYKTSSITCTVQVDYDPRQLSKRQVIEILDSALAERRAPDRARQARSAPADLHGVAAARGGGPVRVPAALAGGGGGVCLHVDPDVQGGAATSCSRRSGSGSTCSTRSWSSAAWGRWRSSPGPCSAGA